MQPRKEKISKKLACTCTGIDESIKSFIKKENEKESSESEKKTVGKKCKCGNDVYDEITMSFKGASLFPGEEASIGALFDRPDHVTLHSIRKAMNRIIDGIENF